MDEKERVTTPQAHPMPGWLSMIPIPGSEEGRVDPEPRTIHLPGFGEIQELDLTKMHPGMKAAIIVEVGDVPEPFDELLSYGDKVYFRGDTGLQIGDYEFMQIISVIAWEKGDNLG